MNYKIWYLRLSLTLLLSAALYIAFSCGWSEDPCDSYVSFTPPELQKQQKARPFLFTAYSLLYECLPDSSVSNGERLQDMNIQEWKQYCKKEADESAIYAVVYQWSLDTLKLLYAESESKRKGRLSSLFETNSMARYLKENKDLEALGYLIHARRGEKLSASADEWSAQTPDTILGDRLIKDAGQLYKAAKKPFIKQRYGMQAMRHAFYSRRYNEVLRLYAKQVQTVPFKGGSVVLRAMDYYAGALYKLGRKAESAYWFARMFDESNDPQMAYSHSLGFVWSYTADQLPQILSFARNPHERATIWAMAAMRNSNTYSWNELKQVYQQEPAHPLLTTILLREVHKIESEYLDYRTQIDRGYAIYDGFNGNPDYQNGSYQWEEWKTRKSNADQHLKKMADEIAQIAKIGNTQNPALWHVLSAYLFWMQDDDASSHLHLEVAKTFPQDAQTRAQARVVELLVWLRESAPWDASDLNHLAKEMNWMDTPEIQQAGYAKIQQNLLRTLLPQQFLKQQDTLRMLLCYHLYENKKSSYYGYTEQPDSVTFTHYIGTNSAYWLDRYCSISQLDTLRRILLKPGTTLDAWLAGNTQYTQAHLRELQAVKRFREFDFEGALTHIQSQDQMPVVPDVFVAHIRDYQDGYPEDDAHSYSLFNLLDTLSQLKKISIVDIRACFNYACALYSLSYHGRSYAAWNYYRASSAIDPYYYDAFRNYTRYERQFYFTEEAARLFERVVRESDNPNLVQESRWMLAKCGQKKCGLVKPEYLGWMDEKSKDYVNWNVNKNTALHDFFQYCQGTPYYEQVYQECSYLRMYAAGK
ncbi:MAG: hypothetical protein JNM44_01435 [Chitinophagaceae bacterium]|nr:hypothetical protein [Chitinophagaceae bacterium]